jgi:hypothetical protein
MSTSAPIVFIASTCYDLTDLRAELKVFLEKDGFVVRLSDDWDSGFRVNPAVDSIESCLENLRTSDVAVFIFDRRYGPELKGKYGDKSATHCEFDLAAELSAQGKMRILTFVRKRTLDELDLWRAHQQGFSPKWVESKRYEKLFELVKQARDLHRAEARSNWIDDFESGVDLREKVLKRLRDALKPGQAGLAAAKQRAPRLRFDPLPVTYSRDRDIPVPFRVRNLGPGVAVGLEAFVAVNGQPIRLPVESASALGVDELTTNWELVLDSDGTGKKCELVCQYESTAGDKYEIRAALTQRSRGTAYNIGEEQFRVLEVAE